MSNQAPKGPQFTLHADKKELPADLAKRKPAMSWVEIIAEDQTGKSVDDGERRRMRAGHLTLIVKFLSQYPDLNPGTDKEHPALARMREVSLSAMVGKPTKPDVVKTTRLS